MMMGFMLTSLYLWQQWQDTEREICQLAGVLHSFKPNLLARRNSPSISREELERQYIKVMRHNELKSDELDIIENIERGEALGDDNVENSKNNQIENLLEGGRSMIDAQILTGLELIKAPVVIGENTTQEMLVTDLCLNFPAIKIRDVEATICDLTATVITDKVIVQGILHKQIFFVDQQNIVRHQPENIPFSFFVDVLGAAEGMDVQIHPVIEHIKTELLCEGSVLHQKVVIEFFVKVTDVRQIFVEVGDGPLFKLERVVGENSIQTLIPNSVELCVPAIKIVEIDSRVEDITCDVIEDKAIIQGIVHKQIFYIDQENIERHLGEDVPFSTFVEIPGATPGQNCQVHPTIEFIKHELNCDGTILEQEIVLEVFVKVTETVQLNLVPGPDVLLKIPEVIGESVKQILLENSVQLPVTAIKIKEIVPSIKRIHTTINKNKVIIQGILHKQIFFIDTENIERHLGEDVPFSTFVEIPGAKLGMDADIAPIIEFVKPELDAPGDMLIQKVVIEFFVKVTQTVQISVRSQPYGPSL